VKLFFDMTLSIALQGEKLLLYTEICTILAKLHPVQTLSWVLTNWSAALLKSEPTEGTSKLNMQLLFMHAATQSCVDIDMESLQSGLVALVDTLVLPSVNSESIELRKASIFLLVELYMRMQEDLLPYIEALTVAQRQLMMIYVEKKRATLVR
jgi:hypothetical protein